MTIFQDKRGLIRSLAAAQARLIAIDGWYGSGKSWLARATARSIGAKWLDLDQLLQKDQETFADHIDLLALANAVALREPLVLSGICMRDVLARIGKTGALHVYVKRMHLGYWTHEDEAEGRGRELDELYPPSALEREVRSYHDRCRPHLTADYVYERNVNPRGL